jgi:hypothetical protein
MRRALLDARYRTAGQRPLYLALCWIWDLGSAVLQGTLRICMPAGHPHVWKCQGHAGGAESLPGVQEQAVVTTCSGIQECKPTRGTATAANTDASNRYCFCNRSSVVGLYQLGRSAGGGGCRRGACGVGWVGFDWLGGCSGG